MLQNISSVSDHKKQGHLWTELITWRQKHWGVEYVWYKGIQWLVNVTLSCLIVAAKCIRVGIIFTLNSAMEKDFLFILKG